VPELPEVETIARSLDAKLRGLEIESLKLLSPHLLKPLKKGNSLPPDELKTRRVLQVQRRGKMILIDCEGGVSILFHLKMTGQLVFCPQPQPLDKHTHLIISFKRQEKELRFRDVRKFGFLKIFFKKDSFFLDDLKKLGPEPLSLDFPKFKRLFERRKARIKSLLLNQRFIAGIGNIYADEILFQARINPFTPVSSLSLKELKRLWLAMRDILGIAVKKGGSSVRNFRNDEGKEGSFQDEHKVYGRQSLPCLCCGKKIERRLLGQRSSFFCPSCQVFEVSKKMREKK